MLNFLDDNQLKSEGAKEIASALREMKLLTKLFICKPVYNKNAVNNGIGADGAKEIALSLEETKILQEIDICSQKT